MAEFNKKTFFDLSLKRKMKFYKYIKNKSLIEVVSC